VPGAPLFEAHRAKTGAIVRQLAGASFFQLTSSPRRRSSSVTFRITLRLLDAGVPRHELNDADVDAVGEEARCAFVAQVVPVQIGRGSRTRPVWSAITAF
jgi:hypothetical protein